MKKFIFLLITILFIFGLFGCQNDNPNNDEGKEDPKVEEIEPSGYISYTVTFYTVGKYRQVSVKQGEKVAEPEVTLPNDYIFLGWFTKDGVKWDFDDPVTKSMDLYLGTSEIVNLPNGDDLAYITINGDSLMYLGYTQQLTVSAYPENVSNDVTWSSSNESVATVDENGLIRTVGVGRVIIRAVSTIDNRISASLNLKVSISEEPVNYNFGGYEVVIMTSSELVKEINPFDENYTDPDKPSRIEAFREIEDEFNCHIKIISYEEAGVFDTASSNLEWLENNAKSGTSECDIVYISCGAVEALAKSNTICDVTNYSKFYSSKSADAALKFASSYHNKIYGLMQKTKPYQINVDLGLFYNYNYISKYGISDPAILFNEGNWNYTAFENWVKETKTKIGDIDVLGGHPYDYYFGLSNTAYTFIYSTMLNQENLKNDNSKNAMTLMQKLSRDGYVNNAPTFGGACGGDENNFYNGGVFMTTGHLDYINDDNYWSVNNGMNWEDGINIGYVPFPYPDNFNKEDTKVNRVSNYNYLFVSGRDYGDTINLEYLYYMMTILSNRISRKVEDCIDVNNGNNEYFNVKNIITETLKDKITNKASIEAIMFYDYNRAIYDSGYKALKSDEKLIQALENVMYNNQDYDQAINDYYE